MRISHVALTTSAALLIAAAATDVSGAVVTTRIVGGQQASAAQFPAIVALVEAGAPAARGQFCGGTVIGPQLVLTAAHCVEDATPGSIEVVSGRSRLSDEGAGARTRVARIDIHPDWRSRFTDAALLHLAGPVSAPALALGSASDGAPGLPAAVAGWGLTSQREDSTSDDLRSATLTIRAAADCRAAHGGDYDDTRMLCASAPGQDSCSGDSGGPLVTSSAGGLRLAGIVSFGGDRCADPEVPGVYTRVSAIAAWAGAQTAAPPSGAALVAQPSTRPRARIGRIACGPMRCRIDVRVSGADAVDAVRIRVRRAASGSRGSFTVTARARRVDGDRFRASVRVPDGVIRLTATPLRAGGSPFGRSDRETFELS
jgi:secreted trypsin-like serine protease